MKIIRARLFLALLFWAFFFFLPQSAPAQSFCFTVSTDPAACSLQGYTPSSISYWTDWLANSFGGATAWMPSYSVGAAVGSDGTVYQSAFYDENAHEVSAWKNGAFVAASSDLHGFSRNSTAGIATGGGYVYAGMTQGGGFQPGINNVNGLSAYPATGTTWNSLIRFNAATLGLSQALTGAYGPTANEIVLSSATTPTVVKPISGLAVGNGNLYASDPQTNTVYIRTTPGLAANGSFAVTNPGPNAVDSSGDVWVVTTPSGSLVQTVGGYSWMSGAEQIQEYSSTGSTMAGSITLPSTVRAGGMCITPGGNLAISDLTANDVLIYGPTSSSSPTLQSTFGTPNGVYSGVDGTVGALQFNGPNGCGYDSNGTFYISEGPSPNGSQLEAYSLSTQLWSIHGQAFVGGAGEDPITRDIYTTNSHYTLNPAANVPGLSTTWVGETLDPTRFPDDPRINSLPGRGGWLAMVIRYVNGTKFMYGVGQQSGAMWVYKFGSDEIARLATAINGYSNNSSVFPTSEPVNTPWDWRDTSGTSTFASGTFTSEADGSYGRAWGMYVDTAGTIWKAMENGYIRSYPAQGIDSNGNPEYSYASSTLTQIPASSGLHQLERALYDPATDSMVIGGYPTGTTDDGCFGQVGKVLERYTSWSTTPVLQWTTNLPFNCATTIGMPKAIDISGAYIFIGEFTSNAAKNQSLIDVYRASTGALIGQITPGAAIGAWTGNLDHTNAISVTKIDANNFDLLMEEDGRNKIVRYPFKIQ